MVYNKWYILPIGGLYATYHLLGEPETTIDYVPDITSDFFIETTNLTFFEATIQLLEADLRLSNGGWKKVKQNIFCQRNY